jgi:hypothetical protein
VLYVSIDSCEFKKRDKIAEKKYSKK